MKFIPLYERVLVQVLDGVKTVDEFVLPDNARDDYLVGTVVASGEGYRRENGDLVPLTIKEGMTVMFGPYAGTKIQVNGQQFLSMREGEIVGWLEK